jgi:carbon storage regulator
MIGDNVEIIIVDVRGDKVRLGITAPKEIPVHRREIYDAIQREKRQKKEYCIYFPLLSLNSNIHLILNPVMVFLCLFRFFGGR